MCVYMYIRHSLFLAWPYKLHDDLMWFLFLFGTQNGREMWWAHVLTFPLKDLHPYDIHLFWADVRERVKQQVFAESSCPAGGTTLSKVRCLKSLWFDNLTTKWNPFVLRIIPYHLQVTSFLSRSKWVGDPALKRTRSPGATWKMSCVHFATRVVQKTPLTEQAKFKSSKWHSTAPNKKATSPDIGQLSHEIGRTVELRQNCIWSSITVEHGAWQERMICAWDMWKRGAVFMAKFQTSSITQTAGKPLANRWQTASFAIFTMSQIHYQNMPDTQISNPACFGASCTVLLCSVVFISFKVRLRRSVEELMNQQLDDVWKLRFPEKMWHFVVFFTIWSIWQRHVMSLPSGRCADRETFSVSLAKTPRVAGGEGHLFPKIWDQCGDQMVSDGIRCRSSWHISTYLDISRHSLTSRHILTYLDNVADSYLFWSVLNIVKFVRPRPMSLTLRPFGRRWEIENDWDRSRRNSNDSNDSNGRKTQVIQIITATCSCEGKTSSGRIFLVKIIKIEIFDQSFPWIGQVAVTESHPPRMIWMAGPGWVSWCPR